jgi:hypothetical protein
MIIIPFSISKLYLRLSKTEIEIRFLLIEGTKAIPFRSKKCLEAKTSFAVLIYSTSTFTLFPMFSFNSPLLNFLVLCNFCKEFVTLIFAPISNHQVSEGTSTILDSKHTNIKVYLSSLTNAYMSCNLPSCAHTNDKSYIFL